MPLVISKTTGCAVVFGLILLATMLVGGAAQAASRADLVVVDTLKPQTRNVNVPLSTPVRAGALIITVRGCRVDAQTGGDWAYLEIDGPEGISANSEKELPRLFSGWMLSASPSLNTLVHPRYAVWLKACST